MLVRKDSHKAQMCMPLKPATTRDCGGGVQFNAAFTGDIPAFEKTDKDSEKEADVLGEWVKTLPEPFNKEMSEIYQEMEEQQTLEARIYKALDKLEALIQHNESDIKTWIPLEYDLQMTYGNEQVKFSEYLTELRAKVREDSVQKIQKKH